MRLQLTVVVRAGDSAPPASPVEVEVRAPTTATVDELADALTALLVDSPRCGQPAIWFAGVPVDGAAPLGATAVVDGAAITLHPRLPSPRPQPPAAVRSPVSLAIAHGPDAGRTIELLPGRHTVGRGAEAAITVQDARISRLHAVLTVTADSVTVADTGSTNGTEHEGVAVGAHPVTAQVGSTITMGDSLLTLRAGDELPAAVTARGDGTFGVNRRPRLRGDPTAQTFTLPSPPVAAPGARTPWVAMLLPLPMAGAMALAFGPTMLAFAVMSPLLMAGTVIGDRITHRRRYAAEHAAFVRHLRTVGAEVDAACDEETRWLRATVPDPAQTLVIATTRAAPLWERSVDDPHALVAGIGWCRAPATVQVVRGTGIDPERPVLERVPCVIALGEAGVTGFCGERGAVLGALRAVLGRLVTLHSPLDIELVIVGGPEGVDEEWSWLGRLPHTRRPDGQPRDGWLLGLDRPSRARAGVAALAAVVRQRVTAQQGRARTWSGPQTLLVVDGAEAHRELPDLPEVLADGPSVGVCVIAIADAHATLPSEAKAVLDLADPARPVLRTPGAVPAGLVVDQVSPWWAERLSRGLAPLRDVTPGTATREPPSRVTLCDLLGLGQPESMAATVAHRWATAPQTTSVPLGLAAAGPFRVDLASDGPHVLVAGTTGAGKSELLRTLVASLAVHNRPEHLSMVLVDYKGGSAFRDCASLPHVAGIVTDLDEHLAARALTALRAELKRRERLLAAAGATDFLAYQSCPNSRSVGLARLVIVIDEFRALAEELPAFVDGMVSIAALGRSLGVHLVLATQRPAGVVTADIKANLNLRIALRLRDRADSLDVLDALDAAAVDPAIPGRALTRVASGALTAFQAAHAGATTGWRQPDGIQVRRLPWGESPGAWPTSDHDSASPTDLCAVARAVADAAILTGARAAPSPWLSPLPARIDGRTLSVRGPWRFPVGLVDEPARQRQRPLEVALDEPGHWGFIGATASGRTTALLALADAATAAVGPDELHVYAVSGGSLAAVAAVPHCGAHVGIDDAPRLARLVARLSEELARRRAQLATARYSSMGDWLREHPTTSPAAVLLLVDDWDLLAQRDDDPHGGQAAGKLVEVLREGAGLGLTAAIGGGRGLLVGAAAAMLTHRVVLRTDDPTDLLVAGLPTRSAPVDQPPGRGLLRDGTEVQLAMPRSLDEWPGRDGPAGATGVAGSTGAGSSPRPPWRVDALPHHVDAGSLRTPAPAGDLVLVGAGGDELGPQGLSPGRDGRQWAVVGGSRSGVSTALATIASSMLTTGRQLCVLGARSTAWDALRPDPRILWCEDPRQVDQLVTLSRRVPDLGLLVDDADQLLDTSWDAVLGEVAAAGTGGGVVVVGARAEEVCVQYRGLAVAVARHRTGILLGPATPLAAELFGVRVPVERSARPGRGYLVRSGVAVPIQVASTTVR